MSALFKHQFFIGAVCLAQALTLLGFFAFAGQPNPSREAVSRDLKLIQDKMLSRHRATDFSMKYLAYESHASSRIIDEGVIKVKKNGGDYRVDIFGVYEMLMTSKHRFVLDHQNKHALLDRPFAGSTPAHSPAEMLGRMDTLLARYGSGFFLKEDGAVREMDVRFSYGEYVRMVLRYSPSDYVLRKVVLYQREADPALAEISSSPARVEILYEKLDFNPSFSSGDFSIDSYVGHQSGKYFLKPRLSGYRFINHLN